MLTRTGYGVGQTRVNFRTRMNQHKNDVTSNKNDENLSGISKHARQCNTGNIDWDNPKILATFNDKSKSALQYNCLVRESLEIRHLKTSSNDGLNDPQLCVRLNAWDPILQKIKWLCELFWRRRGPERFFSLLSPYCSPHSPLAFPSFSPERFLSSWLSIVLLIPLLFPSFPSLILCLSFHLCHWQWLG